MNKCQLTKGPCASLNQCIILNYQEKLFTKEKHNSFFRPICSRSSVFRLSMPVEQMSNRRNDHAPTKPMHQFKLRRKTFHCNKMPQLFSTNLQPFLCLSFEHAIIFFSSNERKKSSCSFLWVFYMRYFFFMS